MLARRAESIAARLRNPARATSSLRQGPPLVHAMDGTGPVPANVQVRFMEGLDRDPNATEAKATDFMALPGLRWLKAECYSPAECEAKAAMLLRCANGRGIVSLGPDRGWPAVLVK